ncbi:MAG: hypothetical protein ACOYNN_00855 [Terrimicrobiaceae bacterium]
MGDGFRLWANADNLSVWEGGLDLRQGEICGALSRRTSFELSPRLGGAPISVTVARHVKIERRPDKPDALHLQAVKFPGKQILISSE